MILAAAVVAILIVMVLSLIRGFIGPTLYDRILALNMFGTKTVLLIALLGFLMGRPEFLDIAIVYALINFISVIAVLQCSSKFGIEQPIEQSIVQPIESPLNNIKDTPR